jgi:hypothetical protein
MNSGKASKGLIIAMSYPIMQRDELRTKTDALNDQSSMPMMANNLPTVKNQCGVPPS